MHKLLLLITIFAGYSQLSICPIPDTLTDLAPVNLASPSTPPITSFIKQIPNLFGLCFAIKTVPHHIVVQIKEFLEEIIPQIPEDNILRFHFQNVLLLLSTYKTIIDTKKDAFKRFTDVIEDLENNDLPAMFQNRHVDDDIPQSTPLLPNIPNFFNFFPTPSSTPAKLPRRKSSLLSDRELPARKLSTLS